MPRAGLIGGSGIGERLISHDDESVLVPTPYGPMRGAITDRFGEPLLVMRRHGGGHKLPPHRVDYAAMAIGAKRLGVQTCLSTAAVGSIRTEWGVGSLVVCDDFLDLSGRNVTLYEDDVVHSPIDPPFPAADTLGRVAQEVLGRELPRGVYLTVNGPRYETPAEIRMMRTLGADLVGMTVSSEAVVMREAGIDYGCLAIVSNPAVGTTEEEVDHEAVKAAVEAVADDAVKILAQAALGHRPAS